MSKKPFIKYFNRILLFAMSIVLLVSCGDDDSTPGSMPVSVEFSSSSLTLTEGDITIVTITFAEAPEAGSFDIALTGTAAYTDDYTTSPTGASGSFTVNVAEGATFATVELTTLDNSDSDGTRTIIMTMSNGTGGVEVGATNALTVSVEDDETPSTPISDVRALFNPAMAVEITDAVIIRGVVTSRNEAVTSRNLFLEDGSGAIVLRFDEGHTFTQGTLLEVNIQGSNIDNFNDLVQIVDNLALADAIDLGAGTLPTPQVITLTQLNSGDFQAELVSVENVSIDEADGLEEFSGNNTINDGAGTAVMRVESFADFADNVLPLGSGAVTGVVGVFQGTAQVLPQERTDVFADNPSATITLDQAIADFGQLSNGQTSASQMYTVTGTGLTENILISAPAQFEVSNDDAVFSSSIEVDFIAANAGTVNVFIRFAPTSGAATMHSGDVLHSSAGAAAQSFGVSGEEVGGTTVLIADDFDYGATPGDLTTITSNWVNHSGTGPLGYIDTSLSMAGYGSSGVGGAVTTADPGGSEDANQAFASQTSGVLYMAALVDIASFDATGNDYFMHFMDSPSTFGFYGRVYAQDDGAGNLNFGIREHSSGSIVYSTSNYTYNTTYLLVVKFDIDAGSASLFVLDNAAATEPGAADAVSDDGDNATMLGSAAIRQGSNGPNAVIDGVRVALDWDGVIGL